MPANLPSLISFAWQFWCRFRSTSTCILETQLQVKSLEKQVEELDSRRAEASTANSIITNEVFALQALMQYKMFHSKKDKEEFDVYMQKMRDDVSAL